MQHHPGDDRRARIRDTLRSVLLERGLLHPLTRPMPQDAPPASDRPRMPARKRAALPAWPWRVR